MCLFKFKSNKISTEALNVLHDYVTAMAEPMVNKILRGGGYSYEIELIDSLFCNNDLPTILYRHFEIYEQYKVGQIVEQPTYLSTSRAFSPYYGKLIADDIGLFIIHTSDTDVKSIDVESLLPSCEGEEEIILPHHLNLRIMSVKKYDKSNYNELLNLTNSQYIIGYKDIANRYNSYTVYDVEIVES